MRDDLVAPRRRRQGPDLFYAAAVGDEKFQQEQEDRGAQRPLEALQRNPLHPLVHLALRHQSEFFLVDRVEPLRAATERDVEGVGFRGDFFQGRFIERRPNDFPGFVAHEILAAVAHHKRNGGALGTADSDGVNGHAVLGGGLRGVDHVALEILTVG